MASVLDAIRLNLVLNWLMLLLAVLLYESALAIGANAMPAFLLEHSDLHAYRSGSKLGCYVRRTDGNQVPHL